MKNERICIVNSNHHYDYCPRCRQYASEPTWKLEFCSEECKNIYMTINKLGCGHIDENEARQELMKYDLSERETLKPEIRTFVDALLPIQQDIVEEEVSAAAPKKSKKKTIVNEL